MKSVRLQILVTAVASALTLLTLAVKGLPPSRTIWTDVILRDCDAVQRHLNWGENVNVRSRSGLSLLVVALTGGRGQFEIVRLLVDRGADVDAADEQGRTALQEALITGDLEVAEFLIAHGADANGRGYLGEPLLVWAAALGRAEDVSFLLAHGADPAVRNQFGKTALDAAIHGKHTEVIEVLRQHGVTE